MHQYVPELYSSAPVRSCSGHSRRQSVPGHCSTLWEWPGGEAVALCAVLQCALFTVGMLAAAVHGGMPPGG